MSGPCQQSRPSYPFNVFPIVSFWTCPFRDRPPPPPKYLEAPMYSSSLSPIGRTTILCVSTAFVVSDSTTSLPPSISMLVLSLVGLRTQFIQGLSSSPCLTSDKFHLHFLPTSQFIDPWARGRQLRRVISLRAWFGPFFFDTLPATTPMRH